MLYEVITEGAQVRQVRRNRRDSREPQARQEPDRPRHRVITSYSIHYTKLYDDIFRGLDVVRVDVGHLGLRDFLELGLGQYRDLVRMGLRGTLLDIAGLLDEDRRGRGLQDEGEGLVRIDGDDDRDDEPGFHALRLVVELVV